MKVAVGGADLAMAVMDVSTAVSCKSVDPLLVELTVNVRAMHINSPVVKKYVPRRHVLQLAQ